MNRILHRLGQRQAAHGGAQALPGRGVVPRVAHRLVLVVSRWGPVHHRLWPPGRVVPMS
jgi:hypothetical protein